MPRGTAVVTLVLLMFLPSALIFGIGSTAESSFSGDVLVSGFEPSQGDQRGPCMAAAADGNISVVWEDATGGMSRIRYSLSQDGGATWSPKTYVNASQPGEQGSPAVAVDDLGTIFVTWASEGPSGPQVFLSYSNDSGASFSGAVEVSPQITGAQLHPDLAVANGTVYVTWAEENATHFDIYLARSSNGGSTFQPALRVDDSEGSSIQSFPSIAAREDTVLVAWHDGRDDQYLDVFAARSGDAGASFGANFKVSDGSGRESRPDVALLPNGSAVVVWQEDRQLTGDFVIRAAASIGSSFLPSVRVDDTDVEANSSDPRVACDAGGNVSVTFTDDRTGYSHIYFAISRDGGMSFTANIRVDHTADDSLAQGASDLALSADGTPMVVFEDLRIEEWSIFFSYMINEPPECELLAPLEGETLQGVVNITGRSQDPDGNDTLLMTTIRIIGQQYDSGWIAVEGRDWWYLFNTSMIINGEYLLQAHCYDGKAYSQLAEASVRVLNPDQPWPDLTLSASDITFSPNEMEVGMMVTIHAKVSNVGNVTAGDVKVRFLRGTVEIGNGTLASIPAGGNATTSVHWMALQGVHTIRVEVDPGDDIRELDEENNQAATQVNVRSAGYYRPDLVVTIADVIISPAELKEGDLVNITVEIWNMGQVNASQVTVVLVVDGQPMGETILGTVPVNGSLPAEFNWTAEAGEHLLELSADPDNATDELDEGNNDLTLTLQVELVEAFPGWYLGAGVAIAFAVVFGAVILMKRVKMKK